MLSLQDLQNTRILILAAGRGRRMGTEIPKPLVKLHDQPLLDYVLKSLAKNFEKCQKTLVVGSNQEWFRDYFPAFDQVIEQENMKGTGDAVAATFPSFAGDLVKPYFSAGKLLQGQPLPAKFTLVLLADVPNIRSETLASFLEGMASQSLECAVLGFEPPNPKGYGRLLTDPGQELGTPGWSYLQKIVEEKDATPTERETSFCNSGIIGFDTAAMFGALNQIHADNAASEYYLTDTISLFPPGKVGAWKAPNPQEFYGVNTKAELEFLEKTAKEL